MIRFLLAVALACLASRAFSDSATEWTPGGYPNLKFDISALTLKTGQAYRLKDPDVWNETSQSHKWHYVFNIGSNIEGGWSGNPPLLPDVCKTTSGADNKTIAGDAVAFQVYGDNQLCHRVAGPLGGKDTYKFDLLDANNPAAGIKLTYLGGDACPSWVGASVKREFVLNLRCEDDGSLLPTELTDEVHEYQTCRYSTEVATSHACPTQCGRDAKTQAVCSGHGVCNYDLDLQMTQCLCEANYYGPSCATKCTPSMCQNAGVCGYNARSEKAECFCPNGWTGLNCAQSVIIDEVSGEARAAAAGKASVSCAAPWVLFVLLLLGLIGFYVYHRRQVGLPINPCADILFASNVPKSGDYSSGSVGTYAPMGETGAI